MHGASFLTDLAVVLLAAGLVTLVFRWLGQPVVLGYIAAGLLIGPHLLPRALVTDLESIHTLAELGVVFLLFNLGLEFHLGKLRRLGPPAFLIAPLETGLLFLVGYALGQAFGWKPNDCLYLGGMLMISSTTIITKTLAEMGLGRERFAEVIYGVLIAEDIIAILLVASLSGASSGGRFEVATVGLMLGKLVLFLLAAVVLGLVGVPRLLSFVGRYRSDETILVVVLGLGFGMAILAARLGFSSGLGAFLMGSLLAESTEHRRIERLVAPVKDLFSAVFFVAIGMLIQPPLLLEQAGPVVLITLGLMGGKILSCTAAGLLAGHPPATAIRVGLGMAQIGEFSFIIAALGSSLGVTSAFLYPIGVAVSAVSSTLTPYLIRSSDRVVGGYLAREPALLRYFLADHRAWLERFRQRERRPGVGRIVRRILLQLGVNVGLMVAFFLGAAVWWQTRPGWLAGIPGWLGGGGTLLWLGALVLSLPILLVTVRKLEAFGLILAELTVRPRASGREVVALRALLGNMLWFIGTAVIAVLILVLSLPLLPVGEMLVLAVLVGLVATGLLRGSLLRLYARAQESVQPALAREEHPPEPEVPRARPPLLEDAELLRVTLQPDSLATGRTLRDLELRRRTGASAVAVRRGGHTNVSPSPDDRLQAGDEVLLLGNADQLAAAERALAVPRTLPA